MTQKTKQNTTKTLKYPLSISFCKAIVKAFSKQHKTIGKPYDGACVYLARHLDTNGVIRAFCEVDEVFTPWVLDTFFDYKIARDHFYNYTFSKKQKKSKIFRAIASPVCARFMTSIVKTLNAIPVYRCEHSAKSINTIKRSVKALEEGKKLIIFIDKEYADKNLESSGEIYKGFLAVDSLYFKRNGKHVPFVPIRFSDKTEICEPVFIKDENAQPSSNAVKENIISAIPDCSQILGNSTPNQCQIDIKEIEKPEEKYTQNQSETPIQESAKTLDDTYKKPNTFNSEIAQEFFDQITHSIFL